MKAKENKQKITEIFEIRLRSEQWKKIYSLAEENDVTFTWISRLCVFKLLENWNSMSMDIKKANVEEKKTMQENEKKLHRHMMCLYGDDNVSIRILATKLGFTITQLVRISLILFAMDLSFEEKSVLVKKGVKLISIVMEFHDGYTKRKYNEEEYRPFRPCFRRFSRGFVVSLYF